MKICSLSRNTFGRVTAYVLANDPHYPDHRPAYLPCVVKEENGRHYAYWREVPFALSEEQEAMLAEFLAGAATSVVY